MTKIKFSDTVIKALSIAIDKNLPFALYIMPKQRKVNFFASNVYGCVASRDLSADESWNGFVIDLFHSQGDAPIGIRADFSAKELIKNKDLIAELPYSQPRANFNTTTPELYMSQINKFVSELRRKDGTLKKAVLSRTVSCLGRNVIDVAQDYFSTFPDTFRYLYYTPLCGMWLGASPELLLDCDYNSNTVATMSLAGTMPADDTQPWSKKNQREHDIVTQYIVAAMQQQGLNPEVSELYEKPFGKVVHLCNDIAARFAPGSLNIAAMLRTLSPTPALCGFPKRQAMRLIEQTETYDRICYGGWVAVKDDSGVHAYVNLRCASVKAYAQDLYHYCVYTGGGIMPDSNYIEEWNETANKAHALCSIISLPGDFQSVYDLTDCTLTINPEFR